MVIYRFGVEGVDLLFGDKLGSRTKNECRIWEYLYFEILRKDRSLRFKRVPMLQR
jgi:hypothetical protein